MGNHENIQLTNFKCEQCNKIFSVKFYLEIHLKNMHGTSWYSGPNEALDDLNGEMESFKSVPQANDESDLKSHETTTHGVPRQRPLSILENKIHDKKNFQCKRCSKQYLEKSKLIKHIETIHDEEFDDFIKHIESIHNEEFDNFNEEEVKLTPTPKKIAESDLEVYKMDFQESKMTQQTIVNEENERFEERSKQYSRKATLAKPTESIRNKESDDFVEQKETSPDKELDGSNVHKLQPILEGNIKSDWKVPEIAAHDDSKMIHQATVCNRSGNFCCKKCSKRYSQKAKLINHMETVHEGKTFKCPSCMKEFTQKENVARHILSMHDKKKDYQCGICSERFVSKQNVLMHIRALHEKMRYKCQSCPAVFSFEASSRRHLESVHQGKKFQCEKCEKLYSDKCYLMRHMEITHEGKAKEQFVCPTCNKLFSQRDNMKRHVKLVHNEIRDYECGACLKRFTSKQTLIMHMNSVHEKKKPFRCRYCPARFSFKGNKKQHIEAAHEAGIMCEKCLKTYTDKRGLAKHMDLIHKSRGSES